MAYTGQASLGIAFLLGGHTVAEFVAKDVSSPQTVHLNAKTRAPTLMRWVHIGLIEAGAFIVIASIIDKRHAGAFIAGATLEGLITEGLYLYAKKLGYQEIDLPPTEQHNVPTASMGSVNYG